MLVEINNQTKEEIDLGLVKKIIKLFLRSRRLNNKEVSLAFVDDKVIKKINKTYRNLDQVTDVLSFVGENNFLGEIIIDYSQIKKQAKQFNHSVKQELIFILVHGLLHLVGYDDATDKEAEEMEKQTKRWLQKFY
ncbi:MAG: rRNA maturation RNase YbeY [Patescibacteria group bacterium]|nr:rRNA maturation RNase YbeY [Patescibacteria group bacterium]MBU1870865.1 rRNA maturation RNase YbeY [Patescibacteria group bacterium]